MEASVSKTSTPKDQGPIVGQGKRLFHHIVLLTTGSHRVTLSLDDTLQKELTCLQSQRGHDKLAVNEEVWCPISQKSRVGRRVVGVAERCTVLTRYSIA